MDGQHGFSPGSFLSYNLEVSLLDENKLDLELGVDCFPWLFEPSLYGGGLKISLKRITVEGWESDDVEIYIQELSKQAFAGFAREGDSSDDHVEACLTDLDKMLHELTAPSTEEACTVEIGFDIQPKHKRRRRGRRAGQRVQAYRLRLLEDRVAGLEATLRRVFASGKWERHAGSRRKSSSRL